MNATGSLYTLSGLPRGAHTALMYGFRKRHRERRLNDMSLWSRQIYWCRFLNRILHENAVQLPASISAKPRGGIESRQTGKHSAQGWSSGKRQFRQHGMTSGRPGPLCTEDLTERKEVNEKNEKACGTDHRHGNGAQYDEHRSVCWRYYYIHHYYY